MSSVKCLYWREEQTAEARDWPVPHADTTEEERCERRLTTQQALPRSAIFTFSLWALRGSSGLRMKSEALKAETPTTDSVRTGPPEPGRPGPASASGFLLSRPLEHPDWVESADSDVADITELEKPDRPEAGLEKRPGAWPLHLSSGQEQVDSELALLLAVGQEAFPFTAAAAAEEEEEEQSFHRQWPVTVETARTLKAAHRCRLCRQLGAGHRPPPPFSE